MSKAVSVVLIDDHRLCGRGSAELVER